jgi:diguanylate cyclase (GGDEF)-like protein
MVSWRDQPTRYDIEALQANIERVGLVIKVRWALVAALATYSVLGAWAYTLETPLDQLVGNMLIPAFAMVFVLGYNTFYMLTYRRLGNIAILNHAQLLFDALVVTVLVYYSGGAHSWFWAMYSLFVLEAAFILPRRWHAWAIAGFCLLANGLVVWGEFFGVLPHVPIPFVAEALHENFTYVSVRYLWQVTVLAGAASVGTMMTSALRRREEVLAQSSIIDEKTGLYDRAYFNRALGSELQRAEHDGRGVVVMLVDIDHFGRFNETFGIEHGDRVLRAVAEAMRDVLRECGDAVASDANLLARFGGEEFVVVLSRDTTFGPLTLETALQIAEVLRASVESVHIADAGVTASIGVARSPEHGTTADDLLTAADAALHDAFVAGGNRVCSSES